MSLNYKIYWIDDDDDFPKSAKETLELKVPENFKFVIDYVYDGERLQDKIQSGLIDLLILDWNLDEDKKDGLQLMEEIHSSGELTEIIFYSQNANVKDQCRGFPGVHTCLKEDIAQTIECVIRRFHERTQHVASMRGMIISEAIDLENKLTEIIAELFGTKSELFTTRILNKPTLDFTKKHSFINGLLRDLITELNKVDSPDTKKIQRFNKIKTIFNCMTKEIILQRNILAHSKKKIEDGVLVLSSLNGGPAIDFNDDWKNEIRSNIKKHLANLMEIRIALVEEGFIDG